MLPRDLLLVFGYASFIWTTLTLITIYGVMPDLLVAGIVYLAAALLVRIRRGVAGTPAWLLLGTALSLGYLAKSVLLLLAPAFFAAAFLVDPDHRSRLSRLVLAIGVWFVIVVPWIGLLSEVKGRFTFGDAGRDTYAWEVAGIDYRHWQGGPPGYGEALHPTRLIHKNPPLYEFGEPIDGTYPVWYDPSYWYEGVRLHFSLRFQVLAIIRSLLIYLPMMDVFLLGWFILLLIGTRGRADLIRTFTAYGFLVFPATIALCMYALVHVQERYVGGFWTLVVLGLMLGVQLPRSDPTRRIYRAGVLAIVLVLMVDLGLMAAVNVRRSLEPPEDWRRSVAVQLHRMGIEPGDRVAWIGGNFDPVWARVARARIVAEVPIEYGSEYWSADQEVRDEILGRLAAIGAEVVYASGVPSGAPMSGWTKITESRFARRLAP